MKIAIRQFGGMIPYVDERLLPDAAASLATNTWLYSGNLIGMTVPTPIHTLVNPNARSVFRVPKASPEVEQIENSFWLEFEAINTTVVRSPVASDDDDPRYYWADGLHPPMYTSLKRLQAGLPPLRLGIPGPNIKPYVLPVAGNWFLTKSRVYVYTWVSTYAEEGPPSPASELVIGPFDATWKITVTPPNAMQSADRVLDKTRIYRLVTGTDGVAQYYFVAEIPIAQTEYLDTLPGEVIAAGSPLQSTLWQGPPEDIEGLVSLPNGMIAAWRQQEIWYCEPYLPHAWPATYQISVDFNIVGMAAFNQMLVIGTENVAFLASGVHPSSVSQTQITGSEPCVSQGSIVTTPGGVVYASTNGLFLCNLNGAQNVTKNYFTTTEWNRLLSLKSLRAALLNGAYYCYSSPIDAAFQFDAFQEDAFQVHDAATTNNGLLIELNDARVAVTQLTHSGRTWNVIGDVWTAQVLLLRDNKVFLHSLTVPDLQSYRWQSKVFQLPLPINMTCAKIVSDQQDQPGNEGTIEYYADNKLKLSRPIPPTGQMFRLPSGYKSDNFQIAVNANFGIDQIEVASSVQELRKV